MWRVVGILDPGFAGIASFARIAPWEPWSKSRIPRSRMLVICPPGLTWARTGPGPAGQLAGQPAGWAGATQGVTWGSDFGSGSRVPGPGPRPRGDGFFLAGNHA